MSKKIIKILFIIMFLAMIVIPLFTTNLKRDMVSKAENRKLAGTPRLHLDDGSFNVNLTADFETWINDNIGQRSKMVMDNARMLYYIFGVFPEKTHMLFGPDEELNYATGEMLDDYRHVNLYSEEELGEFASDMQYLSDYVKEKGAQFYYYQCCDKHSIYPEYFPESVIQREGESKTDGMVRALREHTDIDVIYPKQELIDAKGITPTYSVWGDPTHWNQRGAYIGYLEFMKEIDRNNDDRYDILSESDYDITLTDQGEYVCGCIHRVDEMEDFKIKNPKARLTNEKLTLYAQDQRHRFYTNDSAENNSRILIIGDSYIKSFIIEDIAESFHECVLIWGDYLNDVQSIIDEYDADIVVVEAAERVDRTERIKAGVKSMKESH